MFGRKGIGRPTRHQELQLWTWPAVSSRRILASAAWSGKLAGAEVALRADSLPLPHFFLDFFPMPERIQKPIEPVPWGPKQGDGGGPRSPDVSRPDTKDLLKKMRKVDPNLSKRYRQRTGQ